MLSELAITEAPTNPIAPPISAPTTVGIVRFVRCTGLLTTCTCSRGERSRMPANSAIFAPRHTTPSGVIDSRSVLNPGPASETTAAGSRRSASIKARVASAGRPSTRIDSSSSALADTNTRRASGWASVATNTSVPVTMLCTADQADASNGRCSSREADSRARAWLSSGPDAA